MPTTALLLGAAALILLVLTTAIPPHNRFLALLNNAGHAPIFGAFAWIILRLLERAAGGATATRYLAAFTITVAAGAAVEGLQSLIGRDPSAWDIVMDAAGASAALAAVAAIRAQSLRRTLAFTLGALLAAMIVVAPLAEAALAYARRAATFPVVLLPERRLDLYFLSGTGATITPSLLPSDWSKAPGEPALRVDFRPAQYPGVRHDEPAPDWRGFTSLQVDVTNPGPSPLELVLRVHDADHDQRYTDRLNYGFVLPPESREVISVPMAELERAPAGRPFDLGRVAGLVLFSVSEQPPAGAHFYVARIWLQ